MIKKIVIIMMFAFISCKSMPDNNKLNNDIKNCIEQSSNEYSDDLFNIYDYLKKIDFLLINNGLVTSDDKNSYKTLLEDLDVKFKDKTKNEKYLDIYKKINSELEYAYMLSGPGFLDSPFLCIRYGLKNNNLELGKYFSMYYNVIDKQIRTGLSDNSLLLNFQMIDETSDREFSNIIYRAPIIIVCYTNLEYYIQETYGKKRLEDY